MELAIPLVALGGLYLISNKKKETFSVNAYHKPNQTTDKYFQPNPSYVNESNKPQFTDLAGRKVNLNDYLPNLPAVDLTKEKEDEKDLKTNLVIGKNLERGGPNVEEERSKLKFKKNYAKLTND